MIVVFPQPFSPNRIFKPLFKEITDFWQVFLYPCTDKRDIYILSSVSFRQLLLPQAIRLRDLLVCILAAINNYSKSAGFLQLMSVKISAICIRT